MNNVTYCIPTKNNLRYLRSSIKSILEYASDPEIMVFIDADNDGTEKWLKQQSGNIKSIKNPTQSPMGIAKGYNECIAHASNDVVCMFHADMIMGNGFEANLLKYLTKKTIVSATRIEPPLHPLGKEKIVENFGVYPEEFDQKRFNRFIQSMSTNEKTTNGIFAPWLCYKNDLMEIGMHDENFHSYHEDSDIFQRLILNGYTTIQSWSSFVYHLTCRGGQFQDGIEKITADPGFHTMKSRSFKHFLRKWGGGIRNDEYCHPIMPHKYDIGMVIQNANEEVISAVEPLCSNVYVKCNMTHYITQEQPNCHYDLTSRIRSLTDTKSNDVIVSFDANKFSNVSLGFLFNTFSDILAETNETGEFEYDIFNININRIHCLNDELIHINR